MVLGPFERIFDISYFFHNSRWSTWLTWLTWLWWLGRSALASREEEHEQSVEQIERRQIDETKGLKEEFRKDQEA